LNLTGFRFRNENRGCNYCLTCKVCHTHLMWVNGGRVGKADWPEIFQPSTITSLISLL
jgi:hypothetical protein